MQDLPTDDGGHVGGGIRLPVPMFFMVGAPKCGTTALAEYLRVHPNVFITRPKEPRYFARHLQIDLDSAPAYTKSLKSYLKIYEGVDPRIHRVAGEASTSYLRSPESLKEIRSFNPDARIVVMLRNPVDLAYSWHGQKLLEGQEIVADFVQAWNLQEERAHGKRIPRSLRTLDALQYAKVASVGSQLEELLRIFSRDRVFVGFYDDLAEDPLSLYQSLLEFLEVPYEGRVEFERHRAGAEIRWPTLWRLANDRPAALERWLQPVRRLGGDSLIWMARRLLALTLSERVRLPRAVRQELQETLSPEIRKVEKLTGRDLQSWYAT